MKPNYTSCEQLDPHASWEFYSKIMAPDKDIPHDLAVTSMLANGLEVPSQLFFFTRRRNNALGSESLGPVARVLLLVSRST